MNSAQLLVAITKKVTRQRFLQLHEAVLRQNLHIHIQHQTRRVVYLYHPFVLILGNEGLNNFYLYLF